jgi:transcriptional regulator with XRE-family HTH domain
MTLGKRLRKAREDKNLKNKEAALKFNIDYTTLSKYESDKNEPNLAAIIKMAQIYNCNLDWLLTGEEKYLKPLDLNEEQKELLELFKDVDDYTKGRIVGILEERAKK